jgi:hypothetical protein
MKNRLHKCSNPDKLPTTSETINFVENFRSKNLWILSLIKINQRSDRKNITRISSTREIYDDRLTRLMAKRGFGQNLGRKEVTRSNTKSVED